MLILLVLPLIIFLYAIAGVGLFMEIVINNIQGLNGFINDETFLITCMFFWPVVFILYLISNICNKIIK